MNQDEITQIYETLAPMAGDYANAQAEQIGQAQRSMGPMAANVMGQSQTSGLGNYTYNRLMRPQVDSMRDEILVQGYTNRLNRLLSDALSNAQRNYNRSGGGNSSGKKSDDPDNKGTSGVATVNGTDEHATDKNKKKEEEYKYVGDQDSDTGGWIDEEATKPSALNPNGDTVISGQSEPVVQGGEVGDWLTNYQLKHTLIPWLPFWWVW